MLNTPPPNSSRHPGGAHVSTSQANPRRRLSRNFSLLVQALITRLFTDGAITIDEFNHYCERLRDICQRRKEA
ncbi:hypothetical protein FPT12_22415 [Pseudomonas sp. H3(2019)]|nr:hypothetical protein FPT12_22415 [Pseudomonas sp. H3(2019)]